jgi:hypothetical protein
MWSMEAFPTSVRATAFASTNLLAGILRIAAIRVSGQFVDSTTAVTGLLTVALGFGVGGSISVLLPKETANVAMVEAAHHK